MGPVSRKLEPYLTVGLPPVFMIKISNVTKTVRSGTEDLTILSDVSADIPEGQFIALTGASGSGKSTLLGLIAGLDAPSSGEIFIDGDEITKMSEDRLADIRSRKIGFVFQSFHLIPSLTAYENVLIPMEILGVRDARERAEQLLKDVGLTDRGHHYPAELSGGEQQRVAIARAFANEPKILLADEPTGNLDSKNGQHIFELMTDLHGRRGVTLVLVTHDADLASYAQRQIILRDGSVASDELNHRDAEAQREAKERQPTEIVMN
ncbi:MAG TPA: ABC transporter ATP-binding protein [Pyrinomonadaceae bacterium]|nr:ABC transporter ATP-binding protein [Pyrinomonadaceae bacterium]